MKIHLKNGVNNKNGMIEVYVISLFIIVIICILIFCIIVGIQINTEVSKYRNDLFYIGQNAVMALDKEQLSYESYKIDNEKLIYVIKNLIHKNYKEKSEVTSIYYEIETNILQIDSVFKIKPIVSFLGSEERKLNIHEEIKIKLMEAK